MSETRSPTGVKIDRTEAPDSPGPEFPPEAHLPPTHLDRRQMLRVMAASLGLAGLTNCRRPEHHIVPYQSTPEGMLPGEPRIYATVIPRGPEAVGVLVKSIDGRPVKIEGNELHPASLGRAAGWMQASILELYDPDRSPQVVRRDGSRWMTSTWDQFREEWEKWAEELEIGGGDGLAIVAGASCSPTENRLRRRLRERFPRALWVIHEPVDNSQVYRGIERLLGEPAHPQYCLDDADVILAIEADFLLTETDAVVNGARFARFRADRGRRGGRLYVVESGRSLTGANADHRVALPPSTLPAVVAALAREFRSAGLDVPDPGEEFAADLPLVAEIARELVRAGRRGVIVAGRSLAPELHTWVMALNLALGALQHTLNLLPVDHLEWAAADISELDARIRRGEVSTLVCAGANPVYSAPAQLSLDALVNGTARRVHFGLYRDETAEVCHWHLPESQYLESWGDAVSLDGTPGVIQPLIAPLFDSRGRVEFWSLLAGQELSGYNAVRDTWLEDILGEEEFEAAWNQVLRDGLFRRETRSIAVRVQSLDLPRLEGRRAGPAQVEVVFQPSPQLFDGRYANNGWLQELPDPLTKICWGNAALMSPATAKQRKLESGRVIRLEHQGRSVEAPVFVVPGHADGCASLPLGYGRTRAGRIGTGVGFNAFEIRATAQTYFAPGVGLVDTVQRVEFALTQEHWRMEGRDLWRAVDLPAASTTRPGREPSPPELIEQPVSTHSPQWGMAIDLNLCTGCQACVVACQSENNIPIVGREQVQRGREMHWLRVDRYFMDSAVAFQPVPCMHCENAPCEQVCPVGATVHDSEGLNAMVYNRCIGTRYCSNNCPYKVRRFNFFNYTSELPELIRMAMNPDVTVRSRGVMEKCTYCVQRIRRAEQQLRLRGGVWKDKVIVTACQQTCPAGAISFGDVTDSASEVARWKQDSRNYVLLGALNTRPRTSYLASISNPNPRWRDV